MIKDFPFFWKFRYYGNNLLIDKSFCLSVYLVGCFVAVCQAGRSAAIQKGMTLQMRPSEAEQNTRTERSMHSPFALALKIKFKSCIFRVTVICNFWENPNFYSSHRMSHNSSQNKAQFGGPASKDTDFHSRPEFDSRDSQGRRKESTPAISPLTSTQCCGAFLSWKERNHQSATNPQESSLNLQIQMRKVFLNSLGGGLPVQDGNLCKSDCLFLRNELYLCPQMLSVSDCYLYLCVCLSLSLSHSLSPSLSLIKRK